MPRRYTPWLVLAFVLGAGLLVAVRPTAAEDPPGKGKPKPATVKVEKGPLTAAVSLKGVVEGEPAGELAVRFKSWAGPLTVKKAVEHGTPVKAGDVVVEFETEKIDQAVRDARQERDLADLAIRQAETEFPILEKQLPLDLAVAERDVRHAAEDLKHFLDVDRPLSTHAAEFQVKAAAFYLESAKDELKQLQKMYRDKDLTEETEELVLKRYKQAVEQAEFRLRQTKVQAERTVAVDLPRREAAAKDTVVKAELALVRARDVQPLALRQKQLALAKLRYENAKAKDRLADLEADRAALAVKAPADGLAYHGRSVRGQWLAPVGPPGPSLLPGGTVVPGDVFLTVVNPARLTVRADAEEKELAGLKPGLAGRVAPTAFPDKKLPAKLTRVAAAPQGGRFEVRAGFAGEPPAGVVPGMTCTVRFVTDRKDEALTVPASAVCDDGEGGECVYLPGGSGRPAKRAVKVGPPVGDRVEVLAGLAEGDEILAAKP